MPNVNDLKRSKYLTTKDVEPPVLVTILRYEGINVAREGAEPDDRYVLHFKELPKPMVLNVTNGMLLKQITGSDNFDDWIGKQVILYNDESVMFAGEFTGGIRIRASKRPVETPEDKPTQESQKQQVSTESKFCGDCGKLKSECDCIPF